MRKKAASIIVDILEREDVKFIFGIPGGSTLPIYDALLSSAKVRHVLTRLEMGASYMADAYSRVTGNLGMCMATVGPCAVCLPPGVLAAQLDSIPLMAITGNIRTSSLSGNAQMKFDHPQYFSAVTKWSVQVDTSEQVPEVMEKAIAGMTRCRIIQALGVGFDRIDLKRAGERGIYVSNVPDYCVNEVADHTIGLLLAANRRILGLVGAAKKGMWFSKLPFDVSVPVSRLEGKTLGIVGLGRIGTAVAMRAKAFGMKVLFYDPYLKVGIERSLNLDRSENLEFLLENSDIVTIHTPLTDETYHMIGEEQLKRMKKHALIINTARGAIVNRMALFRALKEEWIAGAALDVIEDEPPSQDEPLLSLGNVVITPHRAF